MGADGREAAPDFWDMVARSRSVIESLSPTADADAHELIISLDRAAKLVALDVTSRVHVNGGLTWPTFRFLFAIWCYGRLAPHELSQVTGMSRPQVSNTSRPLLKDGLIEKVRSETDKRSFVLSLTPVGEEFMSGTFLAHNKLESEWKSALTPVERTLLVELLDRLANSEKGLQVRNDLLDR